MRKSLILLFLLGSLTACGDRERLLCRPTKNKALSSVTNTETTQTTSAPRYADSGKC